MTLNYRSPLTAVLLRRLAWEHYVADHKFTFEEVRGEHLPAARQELGLPPIEATDPTGNSYLRGLFRSPKRLKLEGQHVQLAEPWEKEWRHQYLPSHDDVRRLSLNLLVLESTATNAGSYSAWRLLFRDPVLPELHVFVGPASAMAAACQGHRGVYFVHETGKLYIGQSSQPEKRLAAHGARPTVFAAPEESGTLDQEELTAAEALLISLWGEVAELENASGGRLDRPGARNRQQGVLIAKAASAAVLWLMREQAGVALHDWTIPFRKWPVEGWPECYLRLDVDK
jgi:hypothetical protein